MAIQRDTPYSGMNFSVDLGDGQEDGTGTGLLEVGLPHAALTVLKYRNGNDRDNAVKKLQTTTQYSNLVLKRGALGALNWYAWWNAMRNGEQGIQRNITVRLLSEDHGDVVMVGAERTWHASVGPEWTEAAREDLTVLQNLRVPTNHGGNVPLSASSGRQKAIGRDAQGRVMMEATPTPAFIMGQAKLLLEILVVALNAPTHLGHRHQTFE